MGAGATRPPVQQRRRDSVAVYGIRLASLLGGDGRPTWSVLPWSVLPWLKEVRSGTGEPLGDLRVEIPSALPDPDVRRRRGGPALSGSPRARSSGYPCGPISRAARAVRSLTPVLS